MFSLGRQSRASDGIDHTTRGDVADTDTIGCVTCGTDALLCQIQGVTIQQLCVGYVGDISCDCGHDMQSILVRIGVWRVVGGPIEWTDTVASYLDLVVPVIFVNSIKEIVFEYEAVLNISISVGLSATSIAFIVADIKYTQRNEGKSPNHLRKDIRKEQRRYLLEGFPHSPNRNR